MENIKRFETFLGENESAINEFDFSSLLGSTLGAVGDLGKETIAKYAISYLGISEDSLFGRIFANAFEQVEISEWISLFKDGKIPGNLSNKMAKATIETFTSMGVDGVADKLGIKKSQKSSQEDRKEMFGLFNITGTNQDGLLYRTLSEMIQNKAASGTLEKTLTSFYDQLFGGISKLINKK